jgi:hypothetical protein
MAFKLLEGHTVTHVGWQSPRRIEHIQAPLQFAIDGAFARSVRYLGISPFAITVPASKRTTRIP